MIILTILKTILTYSYDNFTNAEMGDKTRVERVDWQPRCLSSKNLLGTRLPFTLRNTFKLCEFAIIFGTL